MGRVLIFVIDYGLGYHFIPGNTCLYFIILLLWLLRCFMFFQQEKIARKCKREPSRSCVSHSRSCHYYQLLSFSLFKQGYSFILPGQVWTVIKLINNIHEKKNITFYMKSNRPFN